MCVDPGIKNMAIRIEQRNMQYNTMKCIYFAVISINEKSVIQSIISVLDSLKQMILSCHVIAIEKQLWQHNAKAVKVETIISNTILIWTRDLSHTPRVGTQAPSLKYKVHNIDGGGKRNKTQGVQMALSILSSYGDMFSVSTMQNNPNKNDDLADTVLMCSAIHSNIYSL
jgi:Holliday junction resolvasome RuvABC endonuclease subunit